MAWLLQLACPIVLVVLVTQVKDLLFPRALGFLGLLTVAPFMAAAFLKEPETRILIPIWGYIVIALCLFWVGKPYIYRNMVNWVAAKSSRWNMFCMAGMLYGAAVLCCACLWW